VNLCAICLRRLARTDALPFGKSAAHFRCVAGLQANDVTPISAVKYRQRPVNDNQRGR
jgi:hypothetical protein